MTFSRTKIQNTVSFVLAISLALTSSLAVDAKSKAKELKELGDFLYFHGDTEDAIEKFEESLELDPDFVESHMSLINLYLLRKNREKALEHARAVVRLQPDSASNHLLLGNLLRSGKNHAETIKELELALKLGAPEANIRNALGYTYLQTGQFSKALEHFEVAKKYITVTKDATVGGSVCKFRLGKKQEAINDLDGAIGKYHGFTTAMTTKGHLLISMGKVREALASYEQAAKFAPRDYRLYESLANTYFKVGNTEEAEKAFLKSIELNVNNSNAHYGLGWIDQKRSKFSDAAKHFEDGAYVEKNDKVRNNMLKHSYLLKRKAGLTPAPPLIHNPNLNSIEASSFQKVFDLKYSDLVGKPEWKEMEAKAKSAKAVKNGKTLKFKMPKRNVRPVRLH